MANFDQLEIPAPLKPIQPYLKTGKNYQAKDIVVSYWCRLYALQTGLKLSTKTSEETTFLLSVMDWLEGVKKSNSDNESITNEIAAQAYIENWAYKLFTTANTSDRASKFSMSLVLSYYTAGLLYDVLTTFGELTEENTTNRKFAQWRATYINNCLKNGETPEPPPVNDDDNTNESIIDSNNDNEDNQAYESDDEALGSSSTPAQPMQPLMPTMPNVPPLPSTPPHPTPPTNIGAPFQFPSPPVPQQPQVSPAPAPRNPAPTSSVSSDAGVELSLEQSTKAKKYIKWAGSALDYDDTRTAISNLEKALTLLKTGVDPA
ncbi:unnamed protein product [Trichogramma brassicae]|uniref:Vta1/callose synthase N-terminal domain-containing protein n=1 Tax=Trichogramma brassicae TaxID=86971 RepID=A0A6H5I638_9HYME|nr:unnamed protein product [Trichogramma brassicae]